MQIALGIIIGLLIALIALIVEIILYVDSNKKGIVTSIKEEVKHEVDRKKVAVIEPKNPLDEIFESNDKEGRDTHISEL